MVPGEVRLWESVAPLWVVFSHGDAAFGTEVPNKIASFKWTHGRVVLAIRRRDGSLRYAGRIDADSASVMGTAETAVFARRLEQLDPSFAPEPSVRATQRSGLLQLMVSVDAQSREMAAARLRGRAPKEVDVEGLRRLGRSLPDQSDVLISALVDERASMPATPHLPLSQVLGASEHDTSDPRIAAWIACQEGAHLELGLKTITAGRESAGPA